MPKPEEVRLTLPPAQNEVGPSAVMTGAGGVAEVVIAITLLEADVPQEFVCVAE
jgi:hypothetical protein